MGEMCRRDLYQARREIALDVFRSDNDVLIDDRAAEPTAGGGDGVRAGRKLEAVSAGVPRRRGEACAVAGACRGDGHTAQAFADGVEIVMGDRVAVRDA